MVFKASANDVVLPRNVSNIRVLRLSRHFGHGIDDIAEIVRKTFEQLLAQQVLRPSSLVSIERELSKFMAFCISYRRSLQLAELRLPDIDQKFSDLWAHHCLHLTNTKSGHLLAVASRRHMYSVPRVLLLYAKSFGIVDEVPLKLRRVLFPRSKESIARARPYSSREFASIVAALRQELQKVEQDRRYRSSSYSLALRALLVAVRTGLNLTPLLELRRDCLQPHPVSPDRLVLTASKHRANRLVSVSLTTSQSSVSAEVPSDAARIIRQTLDETSRLAESAGSPLSDMVWLFTSRGPSRGTTCRLTQNLMTLHMTRFSLNNQLQDEAGRRLRVSLRRIRKTFVNRIYEKSGGDLFVTAQIANNSPRVSDIHYLTAPDDGERAFATASIRVVDLLKSASRKEGSDQYVRTPIAGCRDPLFGDRAPKDGHSYCQKFVHCFTCKHMVVAGNDLHRLYSFYWFLTRRLGAVRSTPIYSYFKSILRLIDDDIAPRFDARVAELAKAKAREKPHPVWQKADLL